MCAPHLPVTILPHVVSLAAAALLYSATAIPQPFLYLTLLQPYPSQMPHCPALPPATDQCVSASLPCPVAPPPLPRKQCVRVPTCVSPSIPLPCPGGQRGRPAGRARPGPLPGSGRGAASQGARHAHHQRARPGAGRGVCMWGGGGPGRAGWGRGAHAGLSRQALLPMCHIFHPPSNLTAHPHLHTPHFPRPTARHALAQGPRTPPPP